MNFPHHHVNQLRHAGEDTIPDTIKHFAQSIALTPQYWDTADTITVEFEHEGHKAYQVGELFSCCFVSFKAPKQRNDVLGSSLLKSKTA